MLIFFRRIRKELLGDGATSKYLVYAIGEIALVVIGILIALQINNWNERQKQIKEIQSYAISLSSDLAKDIDMVKVNIRQGKRNVMIIDSLAWYTKDKSLSQLSNLQLWLLTRPIGYRPYRWHRSSLNELKSSGTLRYLKNDSLSYMIADYEAFTLHMDQDYIEDVTNEGKAKEWRNQVVDNYYTFPRDSIRIFSITREPEFSIVFRVCENDKYYLKGLEENRSIMATNINIVHTMVNSMKLHRHNMEIRYAEELPVLVADAEKIIEYLKQFTDK